MHQKFADAGADHVIMRANPAACRYRLAGCNAHSRISHTYLLPSGQVGCSSTCHGRSISGRGQQRSALRHQRGCSRKPHAAVQQQDTKSDEQCRPAAELAPGPRQQDAQRSHSQRQPESHGLDDRTTSSGSANQQPAQPQQQQQPEQQQQRQQQASQWQADDSAWWRPISSAYAQLKRQLRFQPSRRHDAEILAIAGPALLSLAADPLLSLVDTAFVGRLGPAELVSDVCSAFA